MGLSKNNKQRVANGELPMGIINIEVKWDSSEPEQVKMIRLLRGIKALLNDDEASNFAIKINGVEFLRGDD